MIPAVDVREGARGEVEEDGEPEAGELVVFAVDIAGVEEAGSV